MLPKVTDHRRNICFAVFLQQLLRHSQDPNLLAESLAVSVIERTRPEAASQVVHPGKRDAVVLQLVVTSGLVQQTAEFCVQTRVLGEVCGYGSQSFTVA